MNNNFMKNTMATDEQKMRREAQDKLANEVKGLLSHEEQEGLRWKGTSVDLMEALHVAYETGLLQDEDGICLSFNNIVRHACRLLHVVVPRNPYETAARGSRRKGLQMNSYMTRYVRRNRGNRGGLWVEIGS